MLQKESRGKILDIISHSYLNNEYLDINLIIYVLATCCVYDICDKNMLDFRRDAYRLMKTICKTPKNLFYFIKIFSVNYNHSSGWNNLHNKAIQNWYNNKNPMDLMYQVTKCNSGNGYNHKDLLRLRHIKAPDDVHNTIYNYIINGIEDFDLIFDIEICKEVTDFIESFEKVKISKNSDEIIEHIEKYNFVKQHIPKCLQDNKEIWGKLLLNMPYRDVLNELINMTKIGVFFNPHNINFLILKLSDRNLQNIEKIHPIEIYSCLKIYNSGVDSRSFVRDPRKEMHGSAVQLRIINILDRAFYDVLYDIIPKYVFV